MKQHWRHNRAALLAALPEGATVVVAGNGLISRTSDTNYSFRQDSNLLYLSGVQRPGVVLIGDQSRARWSLVTPTLSKMEKIFDDTSNWQAVAEQAGLDECIDTVTAIKWLLQKAVEGDIYMNVPLAIKSHGVFANPYRREWFGKLRRAGITVKDARPTLAKLRMVKQDYEIAALQTAVQVTKATLKTIIDTIELYSSISEEQLANIISAKFYEQNLQNAYQPIVACGKNAAVLHHSPDSSKLTNGNALLFDVGVEFQGYAADISRTIVLGANPLTEQLIASVRDVQQKLISQLKPGVTWKSLQAQAVEMLETVAQQHGLLQFGTLSELFPHAIGHFLGLDVHDVGDYTSPLHAGMVITVEPGLYCKPLNLGVRIEDDVLITKTGAKIL